MINTKSQWQIQRSSSWATNQRRPLQHGRSSPFFARFPFSLPADSVISGWDAKRSQIRWEDDNGGQVGQVGRSILPRSNFFRVPLPLLLLNHQPIWTQPQAPSQIRELKPKIIPELSPNCSQTDGSHACWMEWCGSRNVHQRRKRRVF